MQRRNPNNPNHFLMNSLKVRDQGYSGVVLYHLNPIIPALYREKIKYLQ